MCHCCTFLLQALLWGKKPFIWLKVPETNLRPLSKYQETILKDQFWWHCPFKNGSWTAPMFSILVWMTLYSFLVVVWVTVCTPSLGILYGAQIQTKEYSNLKWLTIKFYFYIVMTCNEDIILKTSLSCRNAGFPFNNICIAFLFSIKIPAYHFSFHLIIPALHLSYYLIISA